MNWGTFMAALTATLFTCAGWGVLVMFDRESAERARVTQAAAQPPAPVLNGTGVCAIVPFNRDDHAMYAVVHCRAPTAEEMR